MNSFLSTKPTPGNKDPAQLKGQMGFGNNNVSDKGKGSQGGDPMAGMSPDQIKEEKFRKEIKELVVQLKGRNDAKGVLVLKGKLKQKGKDLGEILGEILFWWIIFFLLNIIHFVVINMFHPIILEQ